MTRAFEIMERAGVPPVVAWALLAIVYLAGAAVGAAASDLWGYVR